MKWVKPDLDRDEVRAMMARYGCDALTATILHRRSLGAPDVARYFLEDEPTSLHNPFLLRDMEKAVNRINLAIGRGETVYLFGDRDVDGVTAAVLMEESLRELGGSAVVAMPEGDDDYGLTEKWIRSVAARGGTLILTVDCGISAFKEIAVAKELGIDVVVTDHHNTPDQLPDCVAVLDPKVPGEVYPFRELSGCAMAWKLDWALHWARTAEYGRDVVLLSTRPANETVVVEARRVRNLCRGESIAETYVPGALRYESTRLMTFLRGEPVFVHGAAAVARDLELAFGAVPPLVLRDLAPEVDRVHPQLADQSLLRILQRPEWSRYRLKPPGELDVLEDLYVALRSRECETAVEPVLGRLDLVALGTLSDLMILRDENRFLVRRGMRILSRSPRRGLRELMDAQGLLDRRLSTRDVAWKLSPVLNAAGRMGQPEAALALFLAPTMTEAAARANALLDLNKQRKALGDKVWDECTQAARETLEQTGGRLLLASSPRIHWGITGVLAARLTAVFKVPAVVVAVAQDKCVGSVRSPNGFSLAGFLEPFHDILNGYGGHDYAAGFSLAPDRLDTFRERLLALGATLDLRSPTEDSIAVDAELPPSYLKPDLTTLVDRFEPYGEGNPPLTFLTRGLVVESMDLLGKGGGPEGPPHARLLLRAQGTKWPAVFWNGAPRVRQGLTVSSTVDVVFRVERNHYMNMESLRLTVVDLAQ